jgi:hypothetical protein
MRDVILRWAKVCKAKIGAIESMEDDIIPYNLEAILTNADLRDADFHKTELVKADLIGAKIERANFSEADLREAKLCGVDFSEVILCNANLSYADLTGGRLIRCDCTGAIFENAIVRNIQIRSIKKLPNRPKSLRLDGIGSEMLNGEAARLFFECPPKPAKVEVVLNQTLSQKTLDTYHDVVHKHQVANRWPNNVEFVHAQKQSDKTIMSFEALKAADVVANLPFLLRQLDSLKALRPESCQTVIIVNGNGNKVSVQQVAKEYLDKHRVHMDNSMVGYFNTLEASAIPEDGIRHGLRKAGEAMEHAELSDDKRAYVLNQLKALIHELEQPKRISARIQRCYQQIKKAAPNVAAILASAADLAVLLTAVADG